MKIVLDTNVLVSGLLAPTGSPARVLAFVEAGTVIVCYDDRILAEYRDVLARPKFASRIDAAGAGAVLASVTSRGLNVGAVNAAPFILPDPDDQPFLDVAVVAGAEAIVTGNARHFPPACGVSIMSPAALLARIASMPSTP